MGGPAEDGAGDAVKGPFNYRAGELLAEGVSLAVLARRLGTPLYVYSAGKIRSQYRALDRAFSGQDHLICYALKANGNLSVVRLLAGLGAGADIVSGGELARALEAGVPASRIVFSGVGKTEQEMAAALRAGILMFNVESAEELAALARAAARLRRTAPVSVRVNPDVAVDTHRHIATGKAETKFGVPIDEAEALYRRAARTPWLRVVGIQTHIGSQILDVRPYRRTLGRLLGLMDRLARAGVPLEILDLGGGMGVTYDREKGLAPRALAGEVLPLLKKRAVRLLFEPGRFLVAESGCLLTRVLYRKRSGGRTFVIVDAAMNDLARPALYDAHHAVLPVRAVRGRAELVDVVGPVCETGDYLARGRRLRVPAQGELLAVMTAGAYGFSMSSQYNARPRAAEVLVDGNRWRLARERETLKDLLRGERSRME